MSVWGTVKKAAKVANPVNYASASIGGKLFGGGNDELDDYYSKLSQSQSDYQNAITQGMIEGRSKSESIYGKGTIANLGTDISDIVSKRKSLIQGEDPSIAMMKRSAGKQEQKAKTGMAQSRIKGPYAQKALGEISLSNQAQIAAQKYKTDQANLNAYQSLLGNIAAASTATELGYGQLRGAGVQTPTAPQNKGLLGSIFG